MYAGKLVFAQLMEFAPWHTFRRLVSKRDLDEITDTSQEIRDRIDRLREILDRIERDPFYNPFTPSSCSIYGDAQIRGP